jgi:hypothetical protein
MKNMKTRAYSMRLFPSSPFSLRNHGTGLAFVKPVLLLKRASGWKGHSGVRGIML